MKIAQLYIYPVKSLRPSSVSQARLTRTGFEHDRCFMLLKVKEDGTYDNMHVSKFSEMVLFHTEIIFGQDGEIRVTYNPPLSTVRSVTIPLRPRVHHLSTIDVDMHGSATKAYKMEESYNAWFSECFGYPVILAYLGEHHRDVLMSTSAITDASVSWFGALASAATSLVKALPSEKEKITFADCAPYLIVSERSMDDVHHRLPAGERMDITKFRPNIVVSDAVKPWEEDYWSQLTINGDIKIECVHNCVRCVSLNIDYATGKPGTTASGKILAKLQRDRRVDPGGKYSPVFGRYCLLHPDSVGDMIGIGDTVKVSRTNSERTTFDWPGLATT